MFRKFGLLLLLAFMLNVSSYLHAEEYRNIEFFQRIVSNKEGLLFEGNAWMKKGLVCVEFEAGGNLFTSIIRDGKVYNFSTASSRGSVSPFTKNPQMPFGPEIFQSKDQMQAFLNTVGVKKMREEDYQGQKCDVYEYTHQQGEAKVLNTLWIWQKGTVPLKAEMKIDDTDVVSIFYDNIKINANIPDKQFNIPEKIKFRKQTSR